VLQGGVGGDFGKNIKFILQFDSARYVIRLQFSLKCQHLSPVGTFKGKNARKLLTA
jgi:hypothetical protein